MLLNFKKNFNLTQFFLLFSFLTFVLSMSTKFSDLLIFQNDNITIYQFLNFARHFGVYFCSILIILLYLNSYKKKKISFWVNKIHYIFLLYFLCHIPGLFLTENNLSNFSFVVTGFSITLNLLLMKYFFSYNDLKKIYFLVMIIFALIVVFTVIPLLENFYLGITQMYGGTLDDSKLFLSKETPRSSGISRIILILLLFSEIFKINEFWKKLIINSIKIILIGFIFLFQSRIIIFLLFVYLVFNYVLNKKFSILHTFKYITTFAFIPILILFFFNSINVVNNPKNKIYHKEPKITALSKSFKNQDATQHLRIFKKDNFTSGRLVDWQNILLSMNENKIYFFGAGSQGDRFLINQSASNAFIYSYASSGLIGLFLFLLITLFLIHRLFFQLVKFNNYSKEISIFSITILFLLIRSLIESSYAVFGIDLVIVLILISIIEINQKNTKC
jgi:hypothetical protein